MTVLLARQEAGSPAPGRARRAAAGWRRPERAPGHPSPRSWRSPAMREGARASTVSVKSPGDGRCARSGRVDGPA
ncbi:hypothetical protein [Streptomyces sp. NBC_00576]|uniref:hypothetical protein n=1 Tax=Streptomyces sp. NBC_00576 TaxID=2903665 RepID=UPI003FCD6FED